jgi:GT2 family glycosyltransferase
MSSVTAIVVSYETRDLLGRCLAALREEQVAAVVVDNASRDGSASFVREHFPEATLVALDQNVGFAAGCNAGAAHAATPFLLLVNPDAAPRPGAVAALVDCCRTSERTAGASPRILDEDGRETVSVLGYPTRWWRGAPPVTSFSGESARGTATRGTLRGQFAVGAALLLRRSAFDEVGGFDPGFFLFYEEVDLCRRLETAGWSLERCPDAVVTHFGGASTRREWSAVYPHQLRGHLRYLEKHEGRRAASTARLVLLASVSMRYLGSRGARRRGYAEGVRWLARADLDEIAALAPAGPSGRAQP